MSRSQVIGLSAIVGDDTVLMTMDAGHPFINCGPVCISAEDLSAAEALRDAACELVTAMTPKQPHEVALEQINHTLDSAFPKAAS